VTMSGGYAPAKAWISQVSDRKTPGTWDGRLAPALLA
jgi:hypothetical protein